MYISSLPVFQVVTLSIHGCNAVIFFIARIQTLCSLTTFNINFKTMVVNISRGVFRSGNNDYPTSEFMCETTLFWALPFFMFFFSIFSPTAISIPLPTPSYLLTLVLFTAFVFPATKFCPTSKSKRRFGIIVQIEDIELILIMMSSLQSGRNKRDSK